MITEPMTMYWMSLPAEQVQPLRLAEMSGAPERSQMVPLPPGRTRRMMAPAMGRVS
jgi:hypothetical protein